ncbi:hypothetical protein Bca4012_054712 [Brassica carinata]
MATPNHPHEIKIVSMDFMAELDSNNNNNKSSTQQQTHDHLPLVSARWDLLICLQGKPPSTKLLSLTKISLLLLPPSKGY